MSDNKQLNGYDLSRNWFDFCLENPEQITPVHTALYFFCIDHCNRLGWREKFGLPTRMAMSAIGLRTWRTYNQAFTDLEKWKFIRVIEKSKNQYSATVIAIAKKAVAQQKQKQRQSSSTAEARAEAEQKQSSSTAVINKPNKLYKPNKHNKPLFDLTFVDENYLSVVEDWLEYKSARQESYKSERSLRAFCTKLINLSGNNPDTAKQITEESMSNNWAGIFQLKVNKQQSSNQQQNAKESY